MNLRGYRLFWISIVTGLWPVVNKKSLMAHYVNGRMTNQNGVNYSCDSSACGGWRYRVSK